MTLVYVALLLLLLGTFSLVTQAQGPNATDADRLVDVGIIVDVTGSFADDLARFRNESTNIVNLIQAQYPQALFGLATFQDYPLSTWGNIGDKPHVLVQNLGSKTSFVSAVNNITATGGGDIPEGQLVSLLQSVTGAGQVVNGTYGTFTIPPKQNFKFRKGAARLIILWTDATFHTPNNTLGYPGPTIAQVIWALVNYGTPAFVLQYPDRRRSLRGNDDKIAADTNRHLTSRSLQAKLGPDAIRVLGMVCTTFSSPFSALVMVYLTCGISYYVCSFGNTSGL
jgi:hypothetical protein